MHQNFLEGLLKNRTLGPIPRVSNPTGLGWGPRIYTSNKFPVNTDLHATLPETTSQKPPFIFDFILYTLMI